MRLCTALFVSFLLIFSFAKAYALPFAVETVLSMTFSGTIHGQEFNSSGTVEEVIVELHRRFPDDPDFIPRDYSSVSFEAHEVRSAELHERYNYGDAPTDGPPHCYPWTQPGWGFADYQNIYQGVFHLYDVSRAGINCGVAGVGDPLGRDHCVRVSCNNNAAIWWCNDNDFLVNKDCTAVAHYAALIVDGCKANRPGVIGQQFTLNENWNVYVRYDVC